MRGRSGNSWLSTRSVIPASAVPEELVAQVIVTACNVPCYILNYILYVLYIMLYIML